MTYEDGKVFQHFGHTQQFKIYDVDNQKVVKVKLLILWEVVMEH